MAHIKKNYLMWLFWLVVITVRVRFEWNIYFRIKASIQYLKKYLRETICQHFDSWTCPWASVGARELDQASTLDRDLGKIAPNVLENISLVMAENPW